MMNVDERKTCIDDWSKSRAEKCNILIERRSNTCFGPR